LTPGFDTWIHGQRFHDGNHCLEAELEYQGCDKRSFTVLATMSPDNKYQVTWNDHLVAQNEPYPGLLEITLDETQPKGQLAISPASEP
jgi:hypothetical protein